MATPPPSDNGGVFSSVVGLAKQASKAVGDVIAPAVATAQPAAAAVTPTTPAENKGITSTGGRRHRKTKALRRSKRRSTRKTTRRVRKAKKGGRKY
jgi:hypothetical protein